MRSGHHKHSPSLSTRVMLECCPSATLVECPPPPSVHSLRLRILSNLSAYRFSILHCPHRDILLFPPCSPVALAASAIAVSVTLRLTIKTPTPSFNVDGLESLEAIAITESSNMTLKSFNNPCGASSPFPKKPSVSPVPLTLKALAHHSWHDGHYTSFPGKYVCSCFGYEAQRVSFFT